MRLQNFNDREKRFHDIKPTLRCHTLTKKTDGAISYWYIATIDWLIVFSHIRLRKAKYDNRKTCWHIIAEGDSNSVYSGFNIYLNHNTEEETQVVTMH